MKILIPIKEAAAIMNISIRAVQIKCKKQGITKIGNQYQITNDILNSWIDSDTIKSETKHEPKQKSISISHTKQNKLRFATSQILTFILMLILLIVSYLFYISLTTEIVYLRNENIKDNKVYKNELKVLQKRLNDANDVIHHQEIEIQYLKIKDSIRKRPKW